MRKKRTPEFVGFFPRKLARSIAKANMEKAGVKHINSVFAYSWREWIFVK